MRDAHPDQGAGGVAGSPAACRAVRQGTAGTAADAGEERRRICGPSVARRGGRRCRIPGTDEMVDRHLSRRGRRRRARPGLGPARPVRDAAHGDPAGRNLGRRAAPVRRTRDPDVVPVARPRKAVRAVKAFDLCGPLPTGTTVLEASAGTGKTHAIGALVTRYVAEGAAALDELLVVTFGRAASQELRERVRGHLVLAERALADPAAARAADDGVHALLATASDEEVALRRDRLRAALAGFDAATIVTTHQFCQYVLTGLGIAGDGDTDVELVESLDDLVVEVVDDLYIRAFAGKSAGESIFDRTTALSLARTVIDDPQARLEPLTEPAGSPAYRRVAFGNAVR